MKPFSPTELVARISAALRKEAAPEPYVLGGLAIHYEQRRVSVAGRDVALTATEYELLRVLSRNKGRLASVESLLRQVWRGRDDGDQQMVRTFVKKLRRKLGDDAARPAYIVNERGVGYRMARPDERLDLPTPGLATLRPSALRSARWGCGSWSQATRRVDVE